MTTQRHRRLHLDTHRGRFLAWNQDTRAEESIDLRAEHRYERSVSAMDLMERHLTSDGTVTTDTFGSVGFADKFKPVERQMLEQRALEVNGADTVDFARVIRAKWSLATPNRSGIVVENEAWDLEKFNGSNPVGSWNHRTSFSSPENIVARWLFAGHERKSPKSDLIGFEEFAPADIPAVGPMASAVLGLYRFGALNAFSPGFLVLEADFNEDDILVFTKTELVELANVPVGRHPDAVIMALADGAVEIGPLRDFIGLQLEVAYSDPMQLMETVRLEAIAAKLGISGVKAMVELSLDEIAALKPPQAVDDRNLELAQALRDGVDAAEDTVASFDAEAWTRFCAALPKEGIPGDEALILLAHAVGLDEASAALGQVVQWADEAVADSVEEEPEAETNAADGEELETETNSDSSEESGVENVVTAETFSVALKKKLASKAELRKSRAEEIRTGRLQIPA